MCVCVCLFASWFPVLLARGEVVQKISRECRFTEMSSQVLEKGFKPDSDAVLGELLVAVHHKRGLLRGKARQFLARTHVYHAYFSLF